MNAVGRGVHGSWVGGLMVIHDLDLLGIRAGPAKANPPLVVDPDRVLAAPAAAQRLQPVARWQAEEGEFDGGIDELEFDDGSLPDVGGQAPGAAGGPKPFRLTIGEAFDHFPGSDGASYPSIR